MIPVRANDASGVILNGQEADLQVRKIVDRAVPAVGALVTFTVTVTNNGPSAATGIVVTDALSAGITVRTATPSQGTYTATTGVWAVGSLASSGPGATATLQIVGQVSQAGTWTNLATRAAQDQTDPNPLNDQGTATIRALFPPPEENTPPVASDDEVPTPVDAPVTIAVLGNDRDPDGDPLTIVAVTQPLGGSVVLNADGTLTYTPRPGFRGSDTFTYTLSDGRGGTVTGTVRVLAVVPAPPGPESVPPGLAPPVGRKTVTVASPLALVWRLVWINPGNSL